MDYEHVSDAGVARQVFIERMGREPKPTEVSTIVDGFVELLRGRQSLSPEEFTATPGAGALLQHLRRDGSEWAVAIATGCWSASARFKMRAAGLDLDGCPAAFSEDGPGREDILRAAVKRAAESYEQDRFQRIVSVGDAAWDVRTAHRLGLPFMGVGNERRAEVLRKRGASHTIEDFLDVAACLLCLDDARVPTGENTETPPAKGASL
jgi:phosphoglycolate phosphatase-like HAD superfamily hydrolase